MSRRNIQLFNLSMLDLLTGALGAIIFLFIITPKGGQSAAPIQQAAIYFDTTQMKIHGLLPDSLLSKMPGDSLLVVMVDHKNLPKKVNAPRKVLAKNDLPISKPTPSPRKKSIANKKPTPSPSKKEKAQPKKEKESTSSSRSQKKRETKSKSTTSSKGKTAERTFKGSPPSVPAAVSFEVNWVDKNDNVDLIICKDGKCVFGGKKRDKRIGQWDSGKSRNRLFGNDLRTNQEAVRQFDKIIPGEYQVYAQFKESKKNNKTITIKGLVYTKNDKLVERGENFSRRLTISSRRDLIGIVKLKANGEYQFIKK